VVKRNNKKRKMQVLAGEITVLFNAKRTRLPGLSVWQVTEIVGAAPVLVTTDGNRLDSESAVNFGERVRLGHVYRVDCAGGGCSSCGDGDGSGSDSGDSAEEGRWFRRVGAEEAERWEWTMSPDGGDLCAVLAAAGREHVFEIPGWFRYSVLFWQDTDDDWYVYARDAVASPFGTRDAVASPFGTRDVPSGRDAAAEYSLF
jgi:hypothetical protein